jgi:hypothetical protein
MSDPTDAPTPAQLIKRVRSFIEYARYVLEPGKAVFPDQFPKQVDADEAMSRLDALTDLVRADADASRAQPEPSPESRFDLLDDPTRGLHAVLTQYGIASRTDCESLVTALVHWAADAYRSSASRAPSPQDAETLSLHRCKICGTRWLLWPDVIHGGGWNLLDKWQRPGSCCDNAAMGDQIEHLRDITLATPAAVVPDPLTDWQPIATAPVEGKFLVSDGTRIMVADGRIYSLSIMPGTPHHLSGFHWTHWMPLPAPPSETALRRVASPTHTEK